MSILEYVSLQPYNTFGLDATAHYFCRVQSKSDIQYLIEDEWQYYRQHLIIGGGSNLLFCSNVDGLAIINEIVGIEIIKEDDDYVWIQCLSGTTWHDVVLYCVDRDWYGIENLSLIPGTIGAAPMQNIGAYGAELKDVFEELEAIDLRTAKSKIFSNAACEFGYRESIFKKAE